MIYPFDDTKKPRVTVNNKYYNISRVQCSLNSEVHKMLSIRGEVWKGSSALININFSEVLAINSIIYNINNVSPSIFVVSPRMDLFSTGTLEYVNTDISTSEILVEISYDRKLTGFESREILLAFTANE